MLETHKAIDKAARRHLISQPSHLGSVIRSLDCRMQQQEIVAVLQGLI